MTTPDDLDDRMTQLREEWPVGSMVDDVMARIGPASPRRVPRRGRMFAGLAASGLLATLGMAWLLIASQPTTILAAVQDGLKRASSAHLTITFWNDQDAASRAEIWYRRDEGLRAEVPDGVIVEDGKTRWSWPTGAGEPPVVLRERSPGFFTTILPEMLALSDVPDQWKQLRTPGLDREVDGQACRGFTLIPPDVKRKLPPGDKPVAEAAFRGIVLAEMDGRVHEITLQRRGADGNWHRVRETRIEYDVPVPAEKIAARLPAGSQVVDRDEAFASRYPLDKALHRVGLGGLILAVHDLQPLKDREGFYVVSSVRGTPEFLAAFPPRRRPVNADLVALDVAFQPGANMIEGGKYDRIVLGNVTRDGVEFSWWMVVPRKFFRLKDGKPVYLPENDYSALPGEPGRLDDMAGKARVPLSATYWDKKHRDAKGIPQGVSTWAEATLPPDRPPTTLDDVVGRARRDLLLMGSGGAGTLLGVAADAKGEARTLRPLSRFAPETVSDADLAAAVRRGLDVLRQFDEIGEVVPPSSKLPPLGGGRPRQ